mgnify:CR=1 FL=1
MADLNTPPLPAAEGPHTRALCGQHEYEART